MSLNRLNAFYNNVARSEDTESALSLDGKHMFKLYQNNYFNVDFDFLSAMAFNNSGDNPVAFTLPNFIDYTNDSDSKVSYEYITNLGMLVQSINTPGIDLGGAEVTESEKLVIPPASLDQPSSNEISLSFLNTEYSVFEYLIRPWLREVASTYWNYDFMPFAKCNIKVQYINDKNTKVIHEYIYHQCYPTSYTMLGLSQASSQDITRDCNFAFEFVTLELKNIK